MPEASCLDKVKRVHEILNYILPQVGNQKTNIYVNESQIIHPHQDWNLRKK